jgi:hypothetical protein
MAVKRNFTSRGLLGQLGGKGGSAGAQTAVTGDLTQQQDDAIAEMLDLFGKLKDSAKKAFKGQDVKLREEFQVGINSPSDLASILDRAKKRATPHQQKLAGCPVAANTASQRSSCALTLRRPFVTRSSGRCT